MIKFLFSLLMFFSDVQALVVRDPSGELFYYDITSEATLEEVVVAIQQEREIYAEPLIDFMAARGNAKNISRSAVAARNYNAPLKACEKDDIDYIVATLGLESLGKVAKEKPNLKKVGDRVDHVHPLNFLYCIFSDSKSRTCYHALKERSWIWSSFKDGIVGSLDQEARANNMKEEYVQDFATKLGIDAQMILPSIRNKDWNQFLKTLAELLPREGNSDRYSM